MRPIGTYLEEGRTWKWRQSSRRRLEAYKLIQAMSIDKGPIWLPERVGNIYRITGKLFLSHVLSLGWCDGQGSQMAIQAWCLHTWVLCALILLEDYSY